MGKINIGSIGQSKVGGPVFSQEEMDSSRKRGEKNAKQYALDHPEIATAEQQKEVTPKEEAPKNYEDLISFQLKGAKFARPIVQT